LGQIAGAFQNLSNHFKIRFAVFPRSGRAPLWRVTGHWFALRNARLFVAEKAGQLGRGGISHLSQLTGMSRVTINQGLNELRTDT
jgi:hypothetical protein